MANTRAKKRHGTKGWFFMEQPVSPPELERIMPNTGPLDNKTSGDAFPCFRDCHDYNIIVISCYRRRGSEGRPERNFTLDAGRNVRDARVRPPHIEGEL